MKLHTFLVRAEAIHRYAQCTCHALGYSEDTIIEVLLPRYSSSVCKHAAVVDVDTHGIIEDSIADMALQKIAELAMHPDVIRPPDPKDAAA
jgi:hypothetical protein